VNRIDATVLHRPLECMASPADIGRLITTDTEVFVDGKLAVVYLCPLPDDLEPMRGAFRRLRYVDDYRTAGMKTNSRVIGYQPRVTLRRDFCTVASSSHEHPADHAIAVDGAAIAARYYAKHNLELYTDHLARAQRIKPEWRLLHTPFTSGIVNDNNPLAYHHDRGNIRGGWSAMFGFKHGIAGGHLATPEILDEHGLALGFEIGDRSLILFDGQGVLHGVTPIQKTRPDAHRFTVVYYSLQQMWNCLTPAEELERIRKLRTEREKKRAAGGHNPKTATRKK
jgi:hypothetical protein